MELNSKEELKKFQKKVMPFVAFLKVRLLLRLVFNHVLLMVYLIILKGTSAKEGFELSQSDA